MGALCPSREGDLAPPGSPLGAPSACCPVGEGTVPLGLTPSSSPSLHSLLCSPSQAFILPFSSYLPLSAFPVLLVSHLSLTHPGLSFFLVLPSWLCVQDPSPWSSSLALTCHSVSHVPCLSAFYHSPGPDSFWGPPAILSSPRTPGSPVLRSSPPFRELSAQTPPLTLPLPGSPLIEMLMRLLLLPPLAGLCTCQVRGRRGSAARFNWKGTSPSPATTWEWGAGGSQDFWSPVVPGTEGVQTQPRSRA